MRSLILLALVALVGCAPSEPEPTEKELNFQYNTQAFFKEVEQIFQAAETGKIIGTQQRLEKLLSAIDPPAENKFDQFGEFDLMEALNRIRGAALAVVVIKTTDEKDMGEARDLMRRIREKYGFE